MQPVNLIGGFYTDDAFPWSAQDTVNWIPELAERQGTRTPAKLRGAPGLRLFGAAGEGPIRGAHDVEGTLFVVSRNTLYQISTTGAATARGTIPGVGRVAMAHNQHGGGYELLVVNGDAGYVWDTSAATFTKITDEGYPGAISADFLDSYLMQVEPFGRFWFHSNLADAKDYNTLDRYESEASPDRIVTARVNQGEVVVFNRTTIEFFANTGAATNTFQSKGIVIDVGCAGRYTVAKMAGTLFWLGSDGVVYQLNGYSATPISTRAIEQAIADEDWANCFALTYESEGHKIVYWTFPNGRTFGFDVVTGLWHRRQSQGMDRWRIATLTYTNRKWIAGDAFNGNLYEVRWDEYTENGEELVAERTSPVMHADQRSLFVDYAELIMDTGHGSQGPVVETLALTSTPYPVEMISALDVSLGAEAMNLRELPSFGTTEAADIGVNLTGMSLRDLLQTYSYTEGTDIAVNLTAFQLREILKTYTYTEGTDIAVNLTGLSLVNQLVTYANWPPEGVDVGVTLSAMSLTNA